MTNYIIPQIHNYQNIDDLLENKNSNRSLFDTGENLSIDELLQEKFVCIVGEPGIGKSRLVEEIISRKFGLPLYHCAASQFESKSVPEYLKYCIIDALDEVDGNVFFSTLQSIRDYKAKNPNVKVLFTCRKHYVASYAKHFASYNDLIYVELCRLRNEDVMGVVDRCSEITKANVIKSSKLRELLTIPRYLTFLLEYEQQKGDITNISDLFEFIIGRSIQTAVNNRQDIKKNESIKIIIQRVLEKVAFIMEISRKDKISRDELYTILDGVKGNMTQMLMANFDILFFESRILKDTNGILKFENTEIQEYLAAKELCRQDNIESVLYDVAVQKDLKHIYPNWYDVIPHISYTEDRIHTFINVIKLIVSYESSLENDSFESLLRYIDPSNCLPNQKEELFSILLEHYLRIPAYIGWKSQILKLMQDFYSSRCNSILMPPIEQSKQFNKIQLANINATLEVIVKENKLDSEVANYWTNAANIFITDDSEEKKLGALDLYNALKDQDNLIRLSGSFSTYSQKVKDRYCQVTGYGHFSQLDIVKCWLEGCYNSNPYAINAVLSIEDPTAMAYAYKKIIEDNKLREFFNPKGTLSVFYELYLVKQFDIAWKNDSESQSVITQIIANYVNIHSYTTYNEIYPIVKQILLNEETGVVFCECFDKDYELFSILTHFDAEHIDIELIESIENLLHTLHIDSWRIDRVLIDLINLIRKDESKKETASKYITRYAETFERWDSNSEEEKRNKHNDQSFTNAYQSLSDTKLSLFAKYNSAIKLSNNLDFIRKQNPKPIVNVIETFLNDLDMDKMILEKKENNSFSISKSLVIIPYFVRVLHHLGFVDLLKKHRLVLAKTLPIVCCTANFDSREIRNIYKSVIGNLDEKEINELIDWWKSRKDDFMNISSDSVFACIKDYGIDALSYKLEEYIDEYINNQDIDHQLTASKSLELIENGYLDWNLEKYRNLFNSLKDDNIESVKMLCNTIMIEKYQDEDSMTWRIDYLKNHVVKSLRNETGHARAISLAESEMISPNPHMFRCFMNIIGNEKLDEQMASLFDVGLSLCDKPDTQEYSSYLLKQIYLFYITTDNGYYMSELRKKVERSNATKGSILANNIMTNAEILFIKNEKVSIDKAIKQYNKCIEESHLDIRNDDDLRRYFTQIHSEVQKEIQDQGIYSLVRQELLSEDFIQRELKNTIINKCCQMGLENVHIDREVTLQDNKRTDFLIRYGLCNPIMVELKLLHNPDIQNEKKRHEYRKKFVKYANATNACLSVFWVFDIHNDGSDTTKFKDLEAEYKNLDNTKVLLTDCKCSSGIDTGLSKNKDASKFSKKSNGKKKNGKK